MIPIKRWDGPSHSVADQQEAARALRAMTPEQYYACFDWDLGDLDSLEHGLFTKATLVASAGNVAVLDDLIRRGASLIKRSQGDFTPLHAAVQVQQAATVRCLLGTAVGTELANSTCFGGATPLMLACSKAVPLIIVELLVPVSDLQRTDADGRTARDRAVLSGLDDAVRCIDLAHQARPRASRAS